MRPNERKILMPLNQNGESLKEKDIPSVSYYSIPLHLQPVFNNLGHEIGDFPIAEKVANQCLSLPMSPYLSPEDQKQVLDTILHS